MRKDWIMTEGEREEKRRKIQENRLRKKDPNSNSDNETHNLNDSNGANSGNECSMNTIGNNNNNNNNNNEQGGFTDDNNNSFGESNKNKPIRRRRRRRRHSQTEMPTNMDISNPPSNNANTCNSNKSQTKSLKTITQNDNQHHMNNDQTFFNSNTNNNTNNNYTSSFNMLANQQTQPSLDNMPKSGNNNSHSSSMVNLLKPNPYLASINQMSLSNVSEN